MFINRKDRKKITAPIFSVSGDVMWVSLFPRHQGDVVHISSTRENNWTKRGLKQTSCFSRKLAESRTDAAFFSMKDQQVHLGTSVLAERGCEMEGTEKKEGKRDTLVWVGTCCLSLRPEISLSPRVTTCYYYGLSDVSEKGAHCKRMLKSQRWHFRVAAERCFESEWDCVVFEAQCWVSITELLCHKQRCVRSKSHHWQPAA